MTYQKNSRPMLVIGAPLLLCLQSKCFIFLITILNSAKKETSSHCQLRLFSANLTCKYLNEHNKVQQLRHKLNKFHRHATNRNGIMCPWTKGGSKSKVTVSIWCGHQLHKYCSASPHGLHQICQLLLWDVTPLFYHGTCKFPDISGEE